MKLRIILITAVILTALTLSACAGPAQPSGTAAAAVPSASDETTATAAAVSAVVTFDAIGEFVRAVGGDRVSVTRLIPDGASAHHFEPRAKDLLALGDAGVLFINGLGMEPWIEDAVATVGGSSLKIVDTSEGLDLIEAGAETGEAAHEEDGHAHEEEHGDAEDSHDDHDEEHEHDHDHGIYDPHVWLGLSTAKKQAENIRDALTTIDPEGADIYRENALAFTSTLDRLQSEYREKFDALPRKDFVTGHAAFAYLCRDLGLHQSSVQNLFAEGEPSARQLAGLVEYSREKGVTTIFSETAANSEVAHTLAEEVGAEVKLIYTMEQSEEGLSYLDRTEKNLQLIYDALKDD